MLILVYVDDCIFFASDRTKIEKMIENLKHEGLEMDPEHDMARFLGVLIEKKDDSYILT